MKIHLKRNRQKKQIVRWIIVFEFSATIKTQTIKFLASEKPQNASAQNSRKERNFAEIKFKSGRSSLTFSWSDPVRRDLDRIPLPLCFASLHARVCACACIRTSEYFSMCEFSRYTYTARPCVCRLMSVCVCIFLSRLTQLPTDAGPDTFSEGPRSRGRSSYRPYN